jgi:hypothetical protein
MSRLVIQNGPLAGTAIALRPGTNRVGRHADNDVQIDDPSVSGHHGEMMLEPGGLRVLDLRSTNGTFVDDEPVREAIVGPGQALRLGTVEFRFEPAVRVHTSSPEAGVLPALPAGMSPCKNHPQHPAEWLCQRCHQLFCVVCAIPRTIAGKSLHLCMACGGQCVPYGLGPMLKPKEPMSFFALFPGAFAYPVKGNGLAILLTGAFVSTIVSLMEYWASRVIFAGILFSVIIKPLYWGYFFSYMEDVIRSSAQGDPEPASWPEFSDMSQDIVRPLIHLLALLAVCFGPAWLLGFDALLETMVSQSSQVPVGKVLAAAGLGLLGIAYFPMALLAVAMAESCLGLNPIVIIPSILRVPGQYLVACCILLGAFLALLVGRVGREYIPIPVLPTLVSSVACFYLLLVQMRVLGLLYYTSQDRLKWF